MIEDDLKKVDRAAPDFTITVRPRSIPKSLSTRRQSPSPVGSFRNHVSMVQLDGPNRGER
jgi:hypothetical protein